MPFSDTSPEAEELQLRIRRSMSGEQRFQVAVEMSELAREFAKARIRKEHPDWDDVEITRELIRLSFLPGEVPGPLR